MTSNEVSAINIAEGLRNGVRLQPVEVVALLHNACEQLEAGKAAALPRSIDDIWITDAGTVVLPRIARVRPVRASVADLLEELLAQCTDPSVTVDSALRSLPARLRDSSPTRAEELKDLLTILRWHLPGDSSEVLRDLVTRLRLQDSSIPAADDIESFGAETTIPATPEVVRPRRSLRQLAIAATVMLTIGAAGYASYIVGRQRTTTTQQARTAAAPAPVPTIDPSPAPAATRAQAPVHLVAHDIRPLNLPVTGGAFSPAFARNGELMFHAGRGATGRLFEASLDDRGVASHLAPMLDGGGRSYHPRPSPDGRWVAFDSDRDGERGVYVASSGGAVQRVSGEGFATAPSWSPDMRWLAFVRAEPSRPKVWNLWLRDVSTGELTRASNFRAGQVWAASWFPGAQAFCYSHEDRLIIAAAGGGTSRSFASPIAGRMIRTPAVSPDGNQIVFQVYRDGVWLLDVGSGQMRRILADPTAEEFAWSPEGGRIAYHSKRDGQWRIWMLGL